MKRIPTHELLDSDEGSPQEIADSLADLRGINRRFGGARVVEKLLLRVAQGESANGNGARRLSWLDVAAASGDIVQLVRKKVQRAGVEVEPVLLDRNASHLPPEMTTVQGDALALPFADDSFDVVSASLLIHHLSPDEVRRFASEALRVCRRAVLINDLVRSPTHLALVRAGTLLFRSRITRHDAVASVKQAYTPREMEEMLKDAPARIDMRRFYLCRMGLLLWKNGR